MRTLLLISVAVCLVFSSLRSQVVTNNCDSFYISPGAVIHINGTLFNDSSGNIINYGNTTVNGNFSNTGNFSSNDTLSISGDISNIGTVNFGGSVNLYGWNQRLDDNNTIAFNNLYLSGSGVKSQYCPVIVNGILDLSDRELAVNLFAITITNQSLTAITRTSGFISTDFGNGKIYRYTNSTGTYLFPLGSSVNTQRYRPVEIKPGTSNPGIYFSGYKNSSPVGMSLTNHDGSFCYLNPDYYHYAGATSYTAQDMITIYYDPVNDGDFDALAYHGGGLWHNATPVSSAQAAPLSSLTLSNWDNQTQTTLLFGITRPALSLPEDSFICSGTGKLISAGSGFDSYLWSTGANTDTILVTSGGTYIVTVTTGLCTVTDSIDITVQPSPVAFAGNDTVICQGESITLSASGGGIYLWSDNSTGQQIVLSPSSSVSVFLTVTNNSCTDTDTVNITVTPGPAVNAGSDTTIFEGQSYTIVPVFNGNILSYSWSPSLYLSNATIPSPVSTPAVSQIYTIIVTDANGCTNSDDIGIYVTEDPNADIIIYNTFTPNNDGTNDTWYIENIDHFPDNYLQIFNRNGHLVYEKTGYANEWDGKYYGNELPAATYYYVLDLKDDRIFKGDITIIR